MASFRASSRGDLGQRGIRFFVDAFVLASATMLADVLLNFIMDVAFRASSRGELGLRAVQLHSGSIFTSELARRRWLTRYSTNVQTHSSARARATTSANELCERSFPPELARRSQPTRCSTSLWTHLSARARAATLADMIFELLVDVAFRASSRDDLGRRAHRFHYGRIFPRELARRVCLGRRRSWLARCSTSLWMHLATRARVAPLADEI